MFAFAQNAPFYKEIQAFKHIDSISFPAKGQILLVGSSSFTKWTDAQAYFPEHPLINRGFGGSSLPDMIRYVNDVVTPYAPKQIIIYCGENDIAASDTVKAALVLERFKTLFGLIRASLSKTPIWFVSIKPSPSRWKFEPVILEANTAIKAFLKKQKRTGYIDIHQDMLLADGSVDGSLFVSDKLHMNPKGYAIWQKKMAPVLK
jgi:lysophospholipase L1-like esterase